MQLREINVRAEHLQKQPLSVSLGQPIFPVTAFACFPAMGNKTYKQSQSNGKQSILGGKSQGNRLPLPGMGRCDSLINGVYHASVWKTTDELETGP